tara:strand:+ start:256 stop:627 length:372 start_codon:yes stop_codon:yes gene_type:complete
MTDKPEIQEIFSKKIRAGRRTYFFDVRSTKAGDYYMTITESIKDINESGESSYRKHKIYLYKEEFNNFKEAFNQVSEFIISEKGEEIISNKKSENTFKEENSEKEKQSNTNFTEVNFEDLGKD